MNQPKLLPNRQYIVLFQWEWRRIGSLCSSPLVSSLCRSWGCGGCSLPGHGVKPSLVEELGDAETLQHEARERWRKLWVRNISSSPVKYQGTTEILVQCSEMGLEMPIGLTTGCLQVGGSPGWGAEPSSEKAGGPGPLAVTAEGCLGSQLCRPSRRGGCIPGTRSTNPLVHAWDSQLWVGDEER